MIREADEWNLIDLEQLFLDSIPKEMLYNILPRAESCLGVKRSEVTRRLMSEIHKKVNHQHSREMVQFYKDSQRRLTPEQCSEIRRRFDDGALGRDLAIEYGVSQATLSWVRNHKGSYADV